MVLPVANAIYIACDDNGKLEDPRVGVSTVSSSVCALTVHKATLDSADVNSLDSVTVLTQDGDGDYRMPTVNDACRDEFDLYATLGAARSTAEARTFSLTRRVSPLGSTSSF
jgi:hypothetical protein